VVGEYGLPLNLDTDWGAHYIPAPVAGGEGDRSLLTQVGQAHARLCVVPIAAYSPHRASASTSVASGGLCAHAVEGLRDWRVFQTLQDRLVKELARKASPSIGPSR
jgi:hypothetical protein